MATTEKTNSYALNGFRGTGRRKCAVARVRLMKGNGAVLINGRDMTTHLGNRTLLHVSVLQPLVATSLEGQYNVIARTHGGGCRGQAEAIRLGVARALAEMNPDYARLMRMEGFLTRDARVKERKKYGHHGARKKPQFSKR
jgi:small subunit ribosomal protein S9